MRIPVAREGWPFILPPAALACTLVLMSWWTAAAALAVIALAFLGFFRDPERTVPDVPNAVVAPADGKVLAIVPVDDAWAGEATRLSIFLSPLDVHVNRAPIAGTIEKIDYRSGKFLMATSERARDENEQNTLTIAGADITVKCSQIAGILARRIVCWKREGDRLECGERFGMIKFGSRTDLMLPSTVEILVKEGMHVRGGITVIGKIAE